MRVLILGGTTEARLLAGLIEHAPGIKAIFSLAGVTRTPLLPHSEIRIGGFGGAEGLKRYLTEQRLQAVIDATHPFAATMSRTAAETCTALNLPLLRLERPAWEAVKGDRWIRVQNLNQAAEVLGPVRRRVFLTTGRKELSPFRNAPQHTYLIRSIDAPAPGTLPPDTALLIERPPFTFASETALMRHHAIEVLVTKNAGSEATHAKLDAARGLGLPVIMVDRPSLPATRCVATPQEAFRWLQTRDQAGTLRDV